jgi:hypothetical protein
MGGDSYGGVKPRASRIFAGGQGRLGHSVVAFAGHLKVKSLFRQ